MKKTATVTWITYKNFGTFLQAYALQQFILSLGYENNIIDDKVIVSKKDNFIARIKKKLLIIFSKKCRKYYCNLQESGLKYEQFKKRQLIIDTDLPNYDILNKKYDVFICGSDQIWYPFFLENDSQDYYFASFSNKKKIAYAPSIGVKSMPEYLKTKMNKLVSQFSYISAREIEGCKILGDIVNKEVTHVVDPTLLLNSSQWANLLSPTCIKAGYILLYLLTYNRKYIEVAFGFARQHKLPIKIFFTQKEYYTIPCEKIYGAGPIEFLNQIKNAEYMLTDSFHGSIFSYIFKTQFVTFKRFKDDSELSQNSRVENLLSELGLSQYLIGEDDCSRINRLEKIDFELAEQHINPLIGKSKSYLINALKDNR